MLKSGRPEEIQAMFETMRKEVRSLIYSVIQLVYFMRGAIQYDDMLLRTPAERQMFQDFISERFEVEKDNPYPNY